MQSFLRIHSFHIPDSRIVAHWFAQLEPDHVSGFSGNKFIKSSTEAISKLSQEILQRVEAEFYTFIDFFFLDYTGKFDS